jgi:hypothetical protein
LYFPGSAFAEAMSIAMIERMTEKVRIRNHPGKIGRCKSRVTQAQAAANGAERVTPRSLSSGLAVRIVQNNKHLVY